MATCGRNNVEMHKLADRGLSAVQIGEQLGVIRMTVARRLAEA
jgi:IS30 family transposase